MGLFDRSNPNTVKVDATEFDQLQEVASSYQQLRRELEDVGYYILNGGSRGIDMPAQQRQSLGRRALKYYLEDPIVGRSVDMLPTYIFGKGLPKPESPIPEIQVAIDEFWDNDDNKLCLTTFAKQYEKVVELQLYNNIFINVFDVQEIQGGGIRLGTIPHEEITDIICDPNNKDKHLWYRREYVVEEFDFTTGDNVVSSKQSEIQVLWYKHWKNKPPTGMKSPPKDKIGPGSIFHLKLGGTSDLKFGVPPVHRVLDWAKAHNEWMRARVALAKAAAQFAWERKLKTGSDPNKVMSIARGWATAARQPDGGTGDWGGNPDGFNTEMHGPKYASMITTNEGVEYNFKGNQSTGSSDAASDQKMFRSQISAGVGLPQHFLGDEGSANLATATAMNEPVIRMMESMQEFWESVFRELLDYHLDKKGLSNITMASRSKIQTNMMDDANGEQSIGSVTPTDTNTKDAVIIDVSEDSRAAMNKPVYKLAFPPILNRDLGSMLTMVIDAVTGLDPAGDNTELTRWAFGEMLKTMGDIDPEKTVNRVFPTIDFATKAGQTDTKNAGGPAPNQVGGTGLGPDMQPIGDTGGALARTSPAMPPATGQGNSISGDQQGARMGTSISGGTLKESSVADNIEYVWDEIEKSLLSIVTDDNER